MVAPSVVQPRTDNPQKLSKGSRQRRPFDAVASTELRDITPRTGGAGPLALLRVARPAGNRTRDESTGARAEIAPDEPPPLRHENGH